MNMMSLFFRDLRCAAVKPLYSLAVLALAALSAFFGSSDAAMAEDLYVVGGNGGDGGASGPFPYTGGGGGYIGSGPATNITDIVESSDDTTGRSGYGGGVSGGNGTYDSGQYFGGEGGNADSTIINATYDAIHVIGGKNGAQTYTDSNMGGGGAASLTAGEVTTGVFYLQTQSSNNPTVPTLDRLGGGASFTATSLQAGTIDIAKGDYTADIGFTVDTLSMSSASPTTMTVTSSTNAFAHDTNMNISITNLDFDLGDGLIDPNTALLTINASANAFSLADSTVHMLFNTGATIGETYTLIESTNAIELPTAETAIMKIGGTLSDLYSFELVETEEDQVLVANRQGGVVVNPGLEALPQGQLAGAILINDDLSWLEAAKYGDGDDCGWSKGQIWASAGGFDQKVSTGSHLDVKGFGLRLGMTLRNQGPAGTLSLGGFFEYGRANYDGAVRGLFHDKAKSDGKVHNLGGGVFATYEWNNGLHFDASFRAGRMKNRLDSDTIDLEAIRYDLRNTYLGAHAGLGYRLSLAGAMRLDMSARYLWTHQNKVTEKVLAEKVRFDAVDSHRLVAGIRFLPLAGASLSPYAGAAFEYEFDGEAGARGASYRFGNPSLKGATGIGEIGVSYRTKDCKFFVDAAAKGYVGKRKGFGGNLLVGMNF